MFRSEEYYMYIICICFGLSRSLSLFLPFALNCYSHISMYFNVRVCMCICMSSFFLAGHFPPVQIGAQERDRSALFPPSFLPPSLCSLPPSIRLFAIPVFSSVIPVESVISLVLSPALVRSRAI